MGRVILICVAVLVLAGSAAQSASPIYVWWARPDDSGDGTSWDTAKKTIQAGLDVVDTGGTVIVRAGGTYTQAASLLIAKPLALQAEFSNDKPLVQMIPGSGTARGVTINSSNVTIRDLSLVQTGSSGDPSILLVPKLTHPWPAPATFQYSDISIIGCILDGSRRAGYITAENLLVQDCVFKNQARDSLYLDGIKGGTITGCDFRGTSNKAIIVENTSDGPYSSGTLSITYNTCYGKGNFFLFGNWPDESSQISLSLIHNSVAGTPSSAIVLYAAGSSSTIWDKLASFVVRDNAITNSGGLAVLVDYTYYTGAGVPTVGAFEVDHCLGYANTLRAQYTGDATGNYGFTTASPAGTSMAMYDLTDDLAEDPLWSDPTHTDGDFTFLLGSPLLLAASDGTNVGAWQSSPGIAGITPNSSLNDGVVSIADLAGNGFPPAASVKLTKSGQADIDAASVVVDSPSKITCNFDLAGKAAGFWNVVVLHGGQSLTLDNGFEVISSILPPVADAGSDQTVPVGPVTLDGSGSHDPQGLDLISYVWKEGVTQIATGANPTVPMAHGDHTISLTVTNSALLSDSDDTNVLIDGPPVANGQSVTATGGIAEPITLTATDPDSDPLTYQMDTPPSHGILTGTPPNVTYTNTPGYTGPDSFTFHANDGWLDSHTATVSITVNAPLPPVANAGPDQVIPVGPATLDGSGSYDPQGLEIVSYVWKEGGVQIATGVNPIVPLAHGAHHITLTVTNSESVPGSDSITVIVDRPPVAYGQSVDAMVGASKAIVLVATDPDGDPLTYHIATAPSHGVITGTPPNIRYTPATFVGADGFTFTANDGWLSSNAAAVNLSISMLADCAGPAAGTWVNDRCFTGGTASYRGVRVANTGAVPQVVYQAQRNGSFTYSIPASNGPYDVSLHFAETEFSRSGMRLFDVYIENRRVLTSFDIFTAARGKNKAIVREFPTSVGDGNGLQIRFVPRRLNATVAGIEVN